MKIILFISLFSMGFSMYGEVKNNNESNEFYRLKRIEYYGIDYESYKKDPLSISWKIRHTKENIFDDLGRLIGINISIGKGKPYAIQKKIKEFKYGEDNLVKSIHYLVPSGSMSYYQSFYMSYELDKKGKIIKKYLKDNKGTDLSYFEYQYNNKSLVEKVTRKSTPTFFTTKFSYDINDRLTSIIYYNGDKTEFTYSGDKVIEQRDFEDNRLKFILYKPEYDDNKILLIDSIPYNKNGKEVNIIKSRRKFFYELAEKCLVPEVLEIKEFYIANSFCITS